MSSKIDPNVYALSIQLSLDSDDAFSKIDDFDTRITDLEQQLWSACQKSISNISTVAESATNDMAVLAMTFMSMDNYATSMTGNLVDMSKQFDKQAEYGTTQLKDLTEFYDTMLKLQEVQIDMGKELEKHLKINETFLKGTESIVDAVTRKNEGHKEQNDLLGNDVIAANAMNQELGIMGGLVNSNIDGWRQSSINANRLLGIIKQIDADTEKFVTANYRAYGSQQQLVQSARNLSLANQVFYENAVAAYQVLGNMKVPIEQMDQYAKILAVGTRTTGVSIQQIGEYSNRLRTTGFSVVQVERSVVHMTEAMRKFGLSTNDVNSLMAQSSDNVKDLARRFGTAQETIEGWDKARITLAAFAKEAGRDVADLASFETWILNDAAAMHIFKAQTNTTEQGIDGYRLAMLRAGLATNAQIESLEEAAKTSDSAASELMATQDALIKTWYGGNRTAYEAARAMGKVAKEANITGSSIEDLDKLAGLTSNTLDNQLIESYNTLTSELKAFGATLWSVVGTVLQPAAAGLGRLLHFVNWLVAQITWLRGVFISFDNTLRKHIPGYSMLANAIAWISSIVVGLVVVFLLAGGALSTFATVAAGSSSVVAGASRVISTMATTMLQIASVIGQSIKILLTAIGEGLAAMGKAVQPVIGPLLGLGLAFMMVGVGAYFFALALQIVVQQGAAAIPAALGMIAVIALLGLVLIGLAMLIQGPVALGLVILSVAFVAIGLAALMVGLGLNYAGVGVQMLAESLSFKLIAQLAMLGGVLIALGMMSLIAAPGLLLMSGIMMILAIASRFLLGSMSGLSDQLTQMSTADAGNMVFVASQFMIAGAFLVVAGVSMLAAALLFVVAAPLMIIAMAAMVTVAGLVLPVATAFLIGSTVMLAASVVFAVAAAILLPASAIYLASAGFISAGSILMLVGANAMILASGFLVAAGAALTVAGLSLFAGLLLIDSSADDIFDIGNKIGVGGTMMLVGAQSILSATSLLQSGASEIGAALDVLADVLPQIGDSAANLAFAGALLVSSGVMFTIAGSLMVGAGSNLYNGMVFIAMATEIANSSSSELFYGAIWLSLAADQLVDASRSLALAGVWLVPAAMAMYVGMKWLEFSITKFTKTVDDIDKISKSVSLVSDSFNSLASIPMGNLKSAAGDALSAVPDIESLSSRLVVASQQLSSAVDTFRTPANELIDIFSRLAQSASDFTAGINTLDGLSNLSTMLDKYAVLLENSTERIETAIRSRAIPAMKAAEEAGIEETLRSEAISTVRVMDETEGSTADNRIMEAQSKMIDVLESIDANTNGEGDKSVLLLEKMVTLLEAYMQESGKGDSPLSSTFNAWGQ